MPVTTSLYGGDKLPTTDKPRNAQKSELTASCAHQKQFFRKERTHGDLKKLSVRGGVLTMGAQGTDFLLKLASTAVLARLLAPSDFGLIAMVTAFTGFVELFKDAGLSIATVQRSQIDHRQVSTLFWINVLLSVALMGSLTAMAPVVAWFYGEPRLVLVTMAFAGVLVLGGLSTQHQALLVRQMQFGVLAVIRICSQLAGIATCIVVAFLGAQYWALVVLVAVSQGVNTLLLWTLCKWRPGGPRFGTGVRPMLALGARVSASNIVSHIQRNADNVIIGFAWGAGALGVYTKAYQLMMLPIQQISIPVNHVALPALCHLRNSNEAFKSYCIQAVSLVASVGMPIVAYAFLQADNLVLLVLGPGWSDAATLFRLLAPAAFFSVVYADTWTCIALDRTDKLVHISVMRTILLVAAFLVAVNWGPIGVAIAFGVGDPILRALSWMYAFRRTPIRVRDMLAALWRPIVASFASATLMAAASAFLLSPETLVVRILWDGAVFAAGYFAVWAVLPGGLDFLTKVAGMVKLAAFTQPDSPPASSDLLDPQSGFASAERHN